MVYLEEIISKKSNDLLQYNNIEAVAFWFFSDKQKLFEIDFELSPEEEIAFKGYKNEEVDKNEVKNIMHQKSQKGINATSNIYKLAALCAKMTLDIFQH